MKETILSFFFMFCAVMFMGGFFMLREKLNLIKSRLGEETFNWLIRGNDETKSL